MMKYTCPMHPEITSKKKGRCPKCGMDIVKQGKTEHQPTNYSSYTPLVVVILLILTVSLAISIRYQDLNTATLEFIRNIMIGFFITFGGFKLMDLKGFVKGYKTYDLIAMRFPQYGYIYPFVELFFGLSMIILSHITILLVLEAIIMGISGLGVLIKLLKKERFQCACLGTFLKVPLTKVTLIEDFGMMILAIVLLIFA